MDGNQDNRICDAHEQRISKLEHSVADHRTENAVMRKVVEMLNKTLEGFRGDLKEFEGKQEERYESVIKEFKFFKEDIGSQLKIFVDKLTPAKKEIDFWDRFRNWVLVGSLVASIVGAISFGVGWAVHRYDKLQLKVDQYEQEWSEEKK